MPAFLALPGPMTKSGSDLVDGRPSGYVPSAVAVDGGHDLASAHGPATGAATDPLVAAHQSCL